MIVSSSVPPHTAQQPLLSYLANRFTYLSESAWSELILADKVWVNGRLSTPELPVKPGDTVRCDMPDFVPEGVNLSYEIIYEDEWLVGLNKPNNLRVHSSGKFVQANLIYLVRQEIPAAHLINRLDAETSGVVLVAKDSETARFVGQQFADGTVYKQYKALVTGIPQPESGMIQLPIGKVSGKRRPSRFGIVTEEGGGKTAVTHYKTDAVFSERLAYLTLEPKTGRTHQLRVHLAALGHPIVSDKLYQFSEAMFEHWKQDRSLPAQSFALPHHALHCATTSITHPHTKKVLTLTAPLPSPFEALLSRLTMHKMDE